VVSVALLTASVIRVSLSISNIKVGLDKLYWVAENTNSSIVYSVIEDAKLQLHRSQVFLKDLERALFVVLIGGSILLVVIDAINKSQQVAGVFLMFMLLAFTLYMPTTNADLSSLQTPVPHFYARVNMMVPPNLVGIGDLIDVSGYITPQPATVYQYSVFYHIGMVDSRWEFDICDWVGAGYFTRIGVGTVFYIEWFIDWVYHEMTAPGVTFGEPLHVFLCAEAGGWCAHVWNSEGNLSLQKSNVDLPLSGVKFKAVAGGESVHPDNHMSAVFSGLTWTTKYTPSGGHELDSYASGYWDGNMFDCEIVEDAPYSLYLQQPYYEFAVSSHCHLSISVAGTPPPHGTTKPSPGTHEYDAGSEVEVTAIPDSGYIFRYWSLDGAVTSDNPITVTMDADHSLIAYFRVDGGGGSDKCYPK
jgi:hypothetical protein